MRSRSQYDVFARRKQTIDGDERIVLMLTDQIADRLCAPAMRPGSGRAPVIASNGPENPSSIRSNFTPI